MIFIYHYSFKNKFYIYNRTSNNTQSYDIESYIKELYNSLNTTADNIVDILLPQINNDIKKDNFAIFDFDKDKLPDTKFDLIVSNPPYICSHEIKNLSDDIKKYEPRIALDGGNDGLDVIKKVIYKSNTILKKKGMLALEIGYGQFRKVSQILKAYNFRNKFLIKDYQNNIRCIMTILEK